MPVHIVSGHPLFFGNDLFGGPCSGCDLADRAFYHHVFDAQVVRGSTPVGENDLYRPYISSVKILVTEILRLVAGAGRELDPLVVPVLFVLDGFRGYPLCPREALTVSGDYHDIRP